MTTATDQERELASLRRRVAELERFFAIQDQQTRYLERERQKLSALVNHTDAGFALIDGERRISWANPVFLARFAPAAGGADVGRDLSVFLAEPVERVLATGLAAHQEIHRPTAQGNQHLYATCMPIKNLGGAVDEIIVMIQDLTDLQVLREARDAAEAASRAKDNFLANVTHEMRTPLNGILGMAELLTEMGLDADQLETARAILDSGHTLLALINDVLDFARLETGRMSIEAAAVDLRATVAQVVDLLVAGAAGKGLSLTCRVAEDVPVQMIGDPLRIRQILAKLLGNAVKFTVDGGVEVRVTTRTEVARGGVVRFEIADTGIGMAGEVIERLFDRFTQGDASSTRRFGGTGLGLAICRQLTALMGGEIGASSAPGCGSTFWCELPLRPSAPSRR